MAISYVTVDVFTDTRFGGNQLSVVLDAGGLDDTLMQAIASEFSYAETTFVRPPADPAHTAEVRIFTPKLELPFAGHPNVGTTYALARIGEVFGTPIGESVLFEEKAGLVPVELHREGGQPVGARLTSPQGFELGDPVRADVIAACCGIAAADIATRVHEPCMASVAIGIELYAPAGGTAPGGAEYTARVFAPEFGVPEDAATGSANVTLVGLLAALDSAADAALVTTISQGVEMGRPSLLVAEADKADGTVTATRIGGRCVPVMAGTLALD